MRLCFELELEYGIGFPDFSSRSSVYEKGESG